MTFSVLSDIKSARSYLCTIYLHNFHICYQGYSSLDKDEKHVFPRFCLNFSLGGPRSEAKQAHVSNAPAGDSANGWKRGDSLVPRNWPCICHRTKRVSAQCHRGERLASRSHLATEPGRWAIACLSVLSSHGPSATTQQSLLPADIWFPYWEAIAGCHYPAADRCLSPEDRHAATPRMTRRHSCRRGWLWSPPSDPF